MTAQRAWGWDLQEMREAGMLDGPMMHDTSENPPPAPILSGFTPINSHSYADTTSTCPELESAATKPRGPKRRRTEPSAATKPSKPRKATGWKKTKRTKTAAQLDCQDISQGLSRTKPTSSGNGEVRVKDESSLGDIPLEQNPFLRKIGSKTIESKIGPSFNDRKRQSEPSGLAAEYQAAYHSTQDNNVNQPTPPTLPKSDEVEAGFDHSCHSDGQDSAIERQASPNIHVEPSIPRNQEYNGSIAVRDFGEPPFTQTSPPTMQNPNSQGTMMFDNIDPLDSTSDDLFEVGAISYGDHDGEDEFPMDDECLEEMMHSMAVPAEEEPLGPDWRPLDFFNDTLPMDEHDAEAESHSPGAISDSDGVVLFDEDPTLVASDIIDASSPAQVSFRGSCILTHTTGNANPDRARTLEGSENCFADDELDDGLVDLMVDDSKSLDVTSPVTPAKRSPSPKLKWLLPKTYTPAKSSQIPVSPAGDLHLLPVHSNGDALPFIRPPFPKVIRDRSPILGLSNRTVLRVCFRIGEALNAAALASRTNIDAIIELYARVVISSREANGGYKQSFQFADLFTDRPPYLSGTYTLWRGVGLWDNDSKELVGEQGRGKMVRVLGRIRRREPVQGQGPGVEMIVLSIWEVDWEDVGIAKGIVCPKQS